MAGPSIVLLPGFMCDERLFEPQVSALRRDGFDVSVGDITAAASVERLASQVLSAAPKRFALAGLSMGAIIAFEILRQAPKRVTHLALLNTTPRADAAGAARKAQLTRVARGELALVLREELKPQYLAPANRTPDRLRLLQEMGCDLGEDVFVRQSISLMARPSSEDLLEHIVCPTLVLGGADDTVCPPELHIAMAEAIPNAVLAMLSDCGHISSLEQPAAVTQCLLDLMSRPAGLRALRYFSGLEGPR